MLRPILPAAAALLMSLSAAAASTFGYHCRPDGFCSASAPADGTIGTTLHIGRPARETYWSIGLKTEAIPDPASGLTVTVDGQRFSFRTADTLGAFGSVNDVYLLGGGAQRVMDAIGGGSTLTVTFTDRAGTARELRFPLTGLTGALIAIDTAQHRIGSERVVAAPYDLAPIEIVPAHTSPAGAIGDLLGAPAGPLATRTPPTADGEP